MPYRHARTAEALSGQRVLSLFPVFSDKKVLCVSYLVTMAPSFCPPSFHPSCKHSHSLQDKTLYLGDLMAGQTNVVYARFFKKRSRKHHGILALKVPKNYPLNFFPVLGHVYKAVSFASNYRFVFIFFVCFLILQMLYMAPRKFVIEENMAS